ncbi:sensor histidine kinase [Micromonospora zhanjiangensis]|uniref:histidine kinase n=1 Tax=Micromonospora zhanjiangensis TaxID=1522057 RepID=A0ABV8KUM9_9ACTN
MSIRWPPQTIRARLTLLYTSLFLASGIALLVLVAVLVFRQPILVTFEPKPGFRGPDVPGLAPLPPPAPAELSVTPTWHTVQALLVTSGIGLAVMAVVSTALGWAVAGRALRPLRIMTVTTRRISERTLHQRLAVAGPRDELTELADTVDELLARLEQAFEAQRRFVANASHELRTPLAMMRTSVDVAVGKPAPVPKQVTVLAGKLYEGLDTADRLLEGLLLLARAQNSAATPVQVVRLADLADAAVGARAEPLAAKRLVVDCRADPVTVVGNATLLRSLVDNLVENAIRHNEPGGWLRIRADARGGRPRLTVENGGPVLDQAAVDLLGQPFQRLGSARTSRPGSGLGLSIVAAVAAAHGGTLVLRARPEGGLYAEVRL